MKLDQSVLVSNQEAAFNSKFLREYNITHIVNCTAETTCNNYKNGISYLNIRMSDCLE